MSRLFTSKKGYETFIRTADGDDADGDIQSAGEMTNFNRQVFGVCCCLFRSYTKSYLTRSQFILLNSSLFRNHGIASFQVSLLCIIFQEFNCRLSFFRLKHIVRVSEIQILLQVYSGALMADGRYKNSDFWQLIIYPDIPL